VLAGSLHPKRRADVRASSATALWQILFDLTATRSGLAQGLWIWPNPAWWPGSVLSASMASRHPVFNFLGWLLAASVVNVRIRDFRSTQDSHFESGPPPYFLSPFAFRG